MLQTVVGSGHQVESFRRISLCRQTLREADSEDEGEIPSKAGGDTPGFGSEESDAISLGEQPTTAHLQAAQAAAAGEARSGELIPQMLPSADNSSVFMPQCPLVVASS